MAYWKCKRAEIMNEGLAVELSFNDEHSCETFTCRIPAEEWKNIIFYRASHEESDRMIRKAIHDASHQAFLLAMKNQGAKE